MVIIGGIIGIFLGWTFRTARGAHADLKVYKARIPNFRRIRNRNGLRSLVAVVIALLVLSALIRG